MKRWRGLAAGLGLVAVLLSVLAHAGSWLVVDRPGPADVIVVLAGETEVRPEKGLDLLRRGVAPRLLLDVPVANVYGVSYQQLAESWRAKLPTDLAGRVQLCPIVGLSTKAEAAEVRGCLAGEKRVMRLLVVTSDYHTRRAGEVFQREGRETGWQVATAAAADPRNFGAEWWRQRQWAKTVVSEWVRWLWWEGVDRWR